tara:strand:+ start:1714 stop:2163 length:450 start_codon:yes stop_codon:yes gene_type:complete
MANLVTTITESVVLNGALRGSSNTVTTAGINDVMERILECTAAQETTIALFAVAPYTTPGAMNVNNVRYVRVTNLDATNDIQLAVTTSTTNFEILISAGNSYVMSVSLLSVKGASGVPTFGAGGTLTSLIVEPTHATEPATVELFVGLA